MTAVTTEGTASTPSPRFRNPGVAQVERPSGARGAESAPGRSLDGKIEVSAHAIATVAAHATADCYGVVGLAPRRSRMGGVERLPLERAAHGVEVRFADDHVVIDVWVILEYGLQIIEVANAIMICVKYAVEQALGLGVARVNVNVQALRVVPQ